MYLQEQSLLDGEFGNNQSGFEGLEQQLMAAVESPERNVEGEPEVADKTEDDEFPFALRDNALAAIGDDIGSGEEEEEVEAEGEGESDSKMYDAIISKVLSNPKIDKRTLLQKFISRMEMESNIHAGALSSELA